MSLKRFAFFLPQFHEIEENNKWWGKGFTEWVNVKNAKPLYKGHKQPKEPLDGYYNLLDKKTVVHQTKLLHEYGIDGMTYYHYYFRGKKLLEKPAENLLKWKDIDQKFFFCWANHPWVKSQDGKKIILQEQEYGDEKDWEAHFNYLLPFFKDKRYEKRNNKPVFMIFKPVFEEKNVMMEFFDKKCKENGFDGIFVINTCSSFEEYKQAKEFSKNINYEHFYFFREPSCGQHIVPNIWGRILRKASSRSGIPIFSGDGILKRTMKKAIHGRDVCHCIFFEWDNTPRHKEFGYVITPVSKKCFMKYYKSLENEEYTFINAWNEWAEGMMLEGTKENGYKYLEWLKEVDDEEK